MSSRSQSDGFFLRCDSDPMIVSRNGTTDVSITTSSSTDDFDRVFESERLRNENAELSEALSQIQLELETLKLSVESERDASTGFPPGTVSALVRDIYDAQKEWQNAMLARQEMANNKKQDDDDDIIDQRNKSESLVSERVGLSAMNPRSLNSLERLRCERDSLIDVLASTKDRLNSLLVTYSLHKSLLSDILCGPTRTNGTQTASLVQTSTMDDTKNCSSSNDVFREDSVEQWPFGEDETLRNQLALETKARKEAEQKCLRLQRLVAVLQRKLRCKHSS